MAAHRDTGKHHQHARTSQHALLFEDLAIFSPLNMNVEPFFLFIFPTPPRQLAPAKLAGTAGGANFRGGGGKLASTRGGLIITAGRNRTRLSPKSAAAPGPMPYI
jgi:hypothetical protein